MCGIVGITGTREVAPLLIEGLRRLEYRGYDSAGLAIQNGASLRIHKKQGKIKSIQKGVYVKL